MTKWTEKQQEAISLDKKNIIVSASAGSGKTAVLTERVLRKIKDGISIDELLVLTFTEKAAAEMKMRIRKKLEEENLYEEVSKIESASISTFDAFSLDLVKKYSSILNISRNISITDVNIVKLYEKKELEKILDKKYLEKESNFLKLIKEFVVKDDKGLKNLLVNVYEKLELIYDKGKYLDEYFDNFYNEEFINSIVDKYNEYLLEQLGYVDVLSKELQNLDDDYYSKISEDLDRLINSKTYEEIKNNSNITWPRLVKSTDIVKEARDNLKEIVNNISSLTDYENEEAIKDSLNINKDLLVEIVSILKELDDNMNILKKRKEIYTFSDIYKLSIKLVTEYKEIREYLKNKYKEIMIDEYQDTNDLQELFISQISNNNLYMVGDIKQSIYKFRNANPDIFNNKYNDYNTSDDDTVIDLNKNFRSRKEVLEDINLVFKELLNKDISFIDYEKEHMMEYGFTNYDELKDNNMNYHMDIYSYQAKTSTEKEDQEIFIIAKDIKNKIDNKIKVYDKNINGMRNIEYRDFTILIDRGSYFDKYKKIFEYLQIPLNIEKDYDLTLEDDIYILKNLIRLIIKIKENTYDEEFKYAYFSVGRSFLFRYSDQDLFLDITSNKYKDSELYKLCSELSNKIDVLPASRFFIKILNSVKYYERLDYITDIKLMNDRIKSIYKLVKSLEDTDKTIYKIVDMLEDLIEDNNIKIPVGKTNRNAVNIMTIHKAKGLEFPICYIGGVYKKFNYDDLKQKIIYDKSLGIVINNSKDNNVLKTLLDYNYKISEIDERTRLLYVALTRACEKLIIVTPELEEKNILNKSVKNNFVSFYQMLESIYNKLDKYIVNKEEVIDNKYTRKNKIELTSNTKLNVIDLDIPKEIIKKERYSKSAHIITTEEKEKMSFGTKVHEILEYIDFNNINIDDLDIDQSIKNKVNNFINSDLIKNNKDSKFYQEYEFIYDDTHGIIDLLIENDGEVIIVDYKLKNIDDEAYTKQLLGYKEAIAKRTNKNILVYLYSIYDEVFKEIKEEI